MSVAVPAAGAEEARARMLELFPEGFEEVEGPDGIELIAYTDPGGEERLWHAFGAAAGDDVAEGWDHRWRDFHRPTRVAGFWIGPPWHEPPGDAIAVVIDPGRAFGTGAHPTTRLCLELLSRLNRGALLDVGCGSGVLSIAAAKLGFRPVCSFDVDEHAVEATRANAVANDVRVDARLADATVDALPAADVAVVNVTREILDAVVPRLRCRSLVSSGYLVADDPPLRGYRHVERVSESGWAADLYEREPQ